MVWFEGFEAAQHDVNGIRVFARHGGKGKPLLVLAREGLLDSLTVQS